MEGISESIDGQVDRIVDHRTSTDSAEPVYHTPQQENSGPVFPWRQADNREIPRSVDHQVASSESTAPTLRKRSLSTLPGDSPPPPPHDSEALLTTPIQNDPGRHALPDLPDSQSVDECVIQGSRNAQPDLLDTTDGLPSFSDFAGSIGAHIQNQEFRPSFGLVATGAGHHPGIEQTGESDLESSVVTTPSWASEVAAGYTVDCFAKRPDGPSKWFTAKLDTGADCNMISWDVVQKWGLTHLIDSSSMPVKPIVGLSGIADIKGVIKLTFSVSREDTQLVPQAKANFKVMQSHAYIDAILSANFVHEWRLGDLANLARAREAAE